MLVVVQKLAEKKREIALYVDPTAAFVWGAGVIYGIPDADTTSVADGATAFSRQARGYGYCSSRRPPKSNQSRGQ